MGRRLAPTALAAVVTRGAGCRSLADVLERPVEFAHLLAPAAEAILSPDGDAFGQLASPANSVRPTPLPLGWTRVPPDLARAAVRTRDGALRPRTGSAGDPLEMGPHRREDVRKPATSRGASPRPCGPAGRTAWSTRRRMPGRLIQTASWPSLGRNNRAGTVHRDTTTREQHDWSIR